MTNPVRPEVALPTSYELQFELLHKKEPLMVSLGSVQPTLLSWRGQHLPLPVGVAPAFLQAASS